MEFIETNDGTRLPEIFPSGIGVSKMGGIQGSLWKMNEHGTFGYSAW
jgi:hypothetical protein